jgi:hypothetical protein
MTTQVHISEADPRGGTRQIALFTLDGEQGWEFQTLPEVEVLVAVRKALGDYIQEANARHKTAVDAMAADKRQFASDVKTYREQEAARAEAYAAEVAAKAAEAKRIAEQERKRAEAEVLG